jgi:hypothetical protein
MHLFSSVISGSVLSNETDPISKGNRRAVFNQRVLAIGNDKSAYRQSSRHGIPTGAHRPIDSLRPSQPGTDSFPKSALDVLKPLQIHSEQPTTRIPFFVNESSCFRPFLECKRAERYQLLPHSSGEPVEAVLSPTPSQMSCSGGAPGAGGTSAATSW